MLWGFLEQSPGFAGDCRRRGINNGATGINLMLDIKGTKVISLMGVNIPGEDRDINHSSV